MYLETQQFKFAYLILILNTTWGRSPCERREASIYIYSVWTKVSGQSGLKSSRAHTLDFDHTLRLQESIQNWSQELTSSLRCILIVSS